MLRKMKKDKFSGEIIDAVRNNGKYTTIKISKSNLINDFKLLGSTVVYTDTILNWIKSEVLINGVRIGYTGIAKTLKEKGMISSFQLGKRDLISKGGFVHRTRSSFIKELNEALMAGEEIKIV